MAKRSRSNVRYIILFVFGLVVVVLAAVLTIVWTMPDIPRPKTDQICMRSFDSETLTCGQTSSLLHDFLEKAIERAYKTKDEEQQEKESSKMQTSNVKLQNLMKEYFIEMKPAAKLTGKPINAKPFNFTDENTGSKMVPIPEWSTGRELFDSDGFQRFEMRYRNGRLVVPYGGTYYIYSEVKFFVPLKHPFMKTEVLNRSLPLRHGINKFNILDGEDREVVSSIQPQAVSNNDHFSAYSSHISTLAELKAGDELSVKVSHPSYLRYPKDNVFGVEMV